MAPYKLKIFSYSMFLTRDVILRKLTYKPNLTTNLYMFQGMWTASFFLGNFAGPTVAGFLVERFGFRFTTFIFFLFNVAIFAVDLIDLTVAVRRSKKDSFYNYVNHPELGKNSFSNVKYSKLDHELIDKPEISKLEENFI